MTEHSMLLDPTSELEQAARQRLQPPKSLDGLTVGLLDITKAKGDIFLDQLGKGPCGRGPGGHGWSSAASPCATTPS